MKIAPDLAAALLAQLPPRLVHKLDADPGMADRWTWQPALDGGTGEIRVETDKGEHVSLAVTDGLVRAARCSCLLSPRCLHVAAVISRLDVDSEGEPPPSNDFHTERDSAPTSAPRTAPGSAPRTAPGSASRTAPTTASHPAAVAAAAHAFDVCADLLARGAESTGAFAQTELLRAIHACRALGLHRLAAAQTRILRSIRDLRADRPEFALGVLSADLREALGVAHALAHGAHTPALVGRARRDYEPRGALRLHGVFTEAVVARSGYAGAVTYLVDDRGALFTRSDVAPGDAQRAAGAYDAAAGLGDAVLPHRALGRAGLFLSEATASPDGRLGAGQAVRAVRASEPSRWDHPALAARWQASLEAQLAAIAEHDAAPDELRPAGWDLVFATGALFDGFLVAGDRALALRTSLDQPQLAARDNLDVLARADGLRVRVIARVRLAAPRQLDLLALAADEPRLALPDAWHGRANLHYDRLSVPAPPATPVDPPAIADTPIAGTPIAGDLLEPLRRRVERLALGGVATLPVHALAELDREATALADRALRGGADVLRELATVASTAERAMTGTRRAVDRRAVAHTWLRAALYLEAASRRLTLASW